MEQIMRALLHGHEHEEALYGLWVQANEAAARERALHAQALMDAKEAAARERKGLEEAAARERASHAQVLMDSKEAAARERDSHAQALKDVKEAAARECKGLVLVAEMARDALEVIKESAARALEMALEAHEARAEAKQREIDQVRGVLGTRSIVERIAHELAPAAPTTTAIAEAFEAAQGKFHTYLTVVASEKSVRLAELVAAGKDVYKDLSSRVHHGEGGEAPFEAVCLQGLPTIKVLALAALFKFYGRKPSFFTAKLPSPGFKLPAVTPQSP